MYFSSWRGSTVFSFVDGQRREQQYLFRDGIVIVSRVDRFGGVRTLVDRGTLHTRTNSPERYRRQWNKSRHDFAQDMGGGYSCQRQGPQRLSCDFLADVL